MHDKVSGPQRPQLRARTTNFQPLTPCRARKPALCGTARRCPMKGLQIRVWSWSWSSKSKSCAAVAVCAQLPQMIERSAFVRSRRYSSSSLEHDSPADSKIVAGAAILVENGPRATGSTLHPSLLLIAKRREEGGGQGIRRVKSRFSGYGFFRSLLTVWIEHVYKTMPPDLTEPYKVTCRVHLEPVLKILHSLDGRCGRRFAPHTSLYTFPQCLYGYYTRVPGALSLACAQKPVPVPHPGPAT